MTTSYTHANDTLSHHAANVAAIAFPISSLVLHLPEALSILLMCLGVGWYGVLFYDRFVKPKNKVPDVPPDATPPVH